MMRTKITDVLSRVLGSEKRRKIVRAMLNHPEKDWSVPELEKTTGAPHATVWRTVLDMENAKILRSRLLGKKTKLFNLIEGSPYLPALRLAVAAEVFPLREVAEEFAREASKLKGVGSCVLYGSVARGAATLESDIDVLVLVKKSVKALKAQITKIAGDVSHRTGRSIVPTVLPDAEFDEMVKTKHEFATAVKKEGIVLFRRGKT
ncbi:MAG: nucleotidyltransferase domain-containing protein [Hadesarchaea archaeon]|nr:nucleotidyltransferase domain-containing protein [Hadesarchaea archaeon]